MKRLNLAAGESSCFVHCTGLKSETEPGHLVSDFGWVGSLVSVSDPMLDPVLSFNTYVYRGVVSTE